MNNLEYKRENKHSCAVVFAQFESSPENFVTSVQEFLNNLSITQALIICHVCLQQPWSENSQQLEIAYLLSKQLQVEKISISNKQELCQQKTGDNFIINNKTITVNFDEFYYAQLEKQFNELPFLFSLNEPFFLDPVHIPKPWGQEIWYTGVEKRGVSKISSAHSKSSIPVPWFLAALPERMLGEKYASKNLVLIKILDPLPQEVVGDLYYELHQEKNEVYVVTDISAKVGQIKMGISQEKIEQYKNNIPQLKHEFLEAIEKYEVIRRKIDAIEEKNKIPQELIEQELLLRKNMDEFAGYLNLQIGDVIAVPILVPHALQHGVRVIEFQTPTYERLIISFAQKVLTQNHWDTKLALELMKAQAPRKEELQKLEQTEHYQVELVCKFPDFYAVRVSLNSLREYSLKKRNFYQILFLVNGICDLNLNGQIYSVTDGQCLFIPACCSAVLSAQNDSTFLICAAEQF
ncbi:MAG: hypothetical protein V4591_02310 [Bdellovibrionota bacterium]